ncbi:MAG: DUF5688 family protein [Eubacterium sp.]|nr:DUF5688 family protein [Eubacterium sp.]
MTKKQEFYNNVANGVSEILGDEMVVEIQEVTKVNLSLDGLTIRKQGENIAPTIYLNQYFNQFNDGRAMDDIVQDIIRVYENNQPENIMNVFKTEDFYDFDKMKEKIVLKVINTERNLDLLEQVPCLDMEGLGLSVVFYVSLMTGEQSAGILIKNEHLKLWEKTVSDLLTVAEVNTNRMHAFVVKSMNEVLSGMFGFEEDLIPEDVPALYVLTDENKTFGASQLYLKDKIREFAKKNDCDVYILPSSVHELLLLRADFPNIEPEHLKQMVCEVNSTEVSDEDFLCDGAFKYILAEDKIIAL